MFLRLNGWRLDVEARPAHHLLTGLLERRERDYEHLPAWIRRSLVRLR